MGHPAEGPVTAVRVGWTGARFRLHLVSGGGHMSIVDGGARPADVVAALTARGVPAGEAEHCVREVEPRFKA